MKLSATDLHIAQALEGDDSCGKVRLEPGERRVVAFVIQCWDEHREPGEATIQALASIVRRLGINVY